MHLCRVVVSGCRTGRRARTPRFSVYAVVLLHTARAMPKIKSICGGNKMQLQPTHLGKLTGSGCYFETTSFIHP